MNEDESRAPRPGLCVSSLLLGGVASTLIGSLFGENLIFALAGSVLVAPVVMPVFAGMAWHARPRMRGDTDRKTDTAARRLVLDMSPVKDIELAPAVVRYIRAIRTEPLRVFVIAATVYLVVGVAAVLWGGFRHNTEIVVAGVMDIAAFGLYLCVGFPRELRLRRWMLQAERQAVDLIAAREPETK